jgi:hypothetical protein
MLAPRLRPIVGPMTALPALVLSPRWGLAEPLSFPAAAVGPAGQAAARPVYCNPRTPVRRRVESAPPSNLSYIESSILIRCRFLEWQPSAITIFLAERKAIVNKQHRPHFPNRTHLPAHHWSLNGMGGLGREVLRQLGRKEHLARWRIDRRKSAATCRTTHREKRAYQGIPNGTAAFSGTLPSPMLAV